MRAESKFLRASAGVEPVDRPFQRGYVEPVALVFAEGAGARDAEAEPAVAARALQVCDERAQLSLAEVGVDVAPAQPAEAGVADDIAADDRAAAGAAVGVGEDRFDGAAGVGRAAVFVRVPPESLKGVPAEVGAAGPGDGRVVELLEAVLADVADRDPRPAVRQCRRRSGRGCAARSCRSRRGPACRRRGWSAAPCRACRRWRADRSAAASRAGRSCSGRCWAGRLPEPPSPVPK